MTETKSNNVEEMFDLTERVSFFVTKPVKDTIRKLAQRRHVSMADLIRSAILSGIEDICPEYAQVYTETIHEEIERMNKYHG